MPSPESSRDEAIKSLDKRAAALEARTTPTVQDYGSKAAGYGYRLIGVLIGGVFVGLGFGAGADVLLKTPPWGMIVGVLTGFVISVWMAVRSAQQMTAEAAREWGPALDLPDDEDDAED